jgi:hypothetical protein
MSRIGCAPAVSARRTHTGSCPPRAAGRSACCRGGPPRHATPSAQALSHRHARPATWRDTRSPARAGLIHRVAIAAPTRYLVRGTLPDLGRPAQLPDQPQTPDSGRRELFSAQCPRMQVKCSAPQHIAQHPPTLIAPSADAALLPPARSGPRVPHPHDVRRPRQLFSGANRLLKLLSPRAPARAGRRPPDGGDIDRRDRLIATQAQPASPARRPLWSQGAVRNPHGHIAVRFRSACTRRRANRRRTTSHR